MDNKMKDVCALFGLSFDEPFALVPAHAGSSFNSFINPYHFTERGLWMEVRGNPGHVRQ